MSPPLFWVGTVPPAGEIATVDGDEGRHAVTVTRVSPGERIIVADGLGTSGLAEVITTEGKASLQARVLDHVAGPRRDRG